VRDAVGRSVSKTCVTMPGVSPTRRKNQSLLRRAAACGLCVAMLAASAPARAGDSAAAEALFLEAKKLIAKKQYAEACTKFAESNRLDRGAGTLIHLANCYEKNKQAASAWATFKEAASAAQALGRADWQKLARNRAAALEPKLAQLTIRVAEAPPGIEVTRDGAPMSQATWGLSIPVDVGPHTVEAKAAGFKPFKADVTVKADGDKLEVIVPKLEAEPESAAAAAPAAAQKVETPPSDAWEKARSGGTQRTLGYIVGGVGIVGLGVGGGMGLLALSKNNASKSECPEDGACASPAAVEANDQARTFGTVSTISFIAGGVLLATGAVLILTAGGGSKRGSAAGSKTAKAGGVRIVPSLGPRGGGLFVGGTF
jgi:hypothetical protein